MLRKDSNYLGRNIMPDDSEFDTVIYKCSVCGIQHILNANDDKLICPCGHIYKFAEKKNSKSKQKENKEELYFNAIIEFSEGGRYAAE